MVSDECLTMDRTSLTDGRKGSLAIIHGTILELEPLIKSHWFY